MWELENIMLPELVNNIKKNPSLTMEIKGINYSDMLSDGDMVDSKNISARRYPYISTRKKRDPYTSIDGVNAIDVMVYDGKLITVKQTSSSSTNIAYNEQILTPSGLSAGEKQMAIVNTKLVVFPDKVMYDFKTQTLKSLEAEFHAESYFTQNSLYMHTETRGLITGAGFKKGDTIKISGCSVADNNKEITIQSMTYDEDTGFSRIRTSENAFTPVAWNEGGLNDLIKIKREVPNLDFICEADNRLWGVSNADKTIYASALGDPTNFHTYEGVSTDSYAVAVGSEGDFTGCCKLGTSVLFWKEDKLHKMMGSYPAEYTLYTYEIEGVAKGSHKSMVVINDSLYYLGLHGVFVYNGSYPISISQNFGERIFTNGVGGTDGDSYFLSCKDGNEDFFFVYELKHNIWIKEDDFYAMAFARIGRDVYYADGERVYKLYGTEDDPNMEWLIHFAPMYESIEGKKCYSKFILRVEMPENSYLLFHVKQDDGKWDVYSAQSTTPRPYTFLV